MPPIDFDAAARIGLPMTVSLLFLGIAVPVLAAVIKRGLQQIAHGDGNGAPSLQGIGERLDSINERLRHGDLRMTRIEKRLDSLPCATCTEPAVDEGKGQT